MARSCCNVRTKRSASCNAHAEHCNPVFDRRITQKGNLRVNKLQRNQLLLQRRERTVGNAGGGGGGWQWIRTAATRVSSIDYFNIHLRLSGLSADGKETSGRAGSWAQEISTSRSDIIFLSFSRPVPIASHCFVYFSSSSSSSFLSYTFFMTARQILKCSRWVTPTWRRWTSWGERERKKE